ncbi:Protein of unknown function [Gryllus bimaculatus]|nr:Protein of unknown function [Gryllus bimaculatus]
MAQPRTLNLDVVSGPDLFPLLRPRDVGKERASTSVWSLRRPSLARPEQSGSAGINKTGSGVVTACPVFSRT